MAKNRLAELMAKRKIRSLAKISADTGISRTTLTNLYYERTNGIEFETLEKLCCYFKCGVDELLKYQ